MNEDEKELMQGWQDKVRSSYGDEARLYQYLFETLDNFYYRYIETTLNKNLKTTELTPGTWGAISYENNMVEALKVASRETKTVIMDLAKSVPKAQNPQVRYGLMVKVQELTADRGHLILQAEVLGLKSVTKEVDFTYQDLGQFRKELALKLESVCEIFI